MNYTFYAISLYIIMRGLQVLLEEHAQKRWYKVLIKAVTIFMLYAALASIIVWYYTGIKFLGFDAGR